MFGRQRCQPREFIPRHVHRSGYVAIVLSGGYEEAGDVGLVMTAPGNAVFHAAFDAHLDRVGSKGADILNLELPAGFSRSCVRTGLDDPDLVMRTAECDAREALAMVLQGAFRECTAGENWPDRLAQELRDNLHLEIGAWCSRNGLRPETVSRRFRTIFGVSPRTFRAHTRVRAARSMLVNDSLPLAGIASRCGFSDQAHMTRHMKCVTGATPKALRRAVK